MKEKSDIYNTLADVYFSSGSKGGQGEKPAIPIEKKRWMWFSVLVNVLLFLVVIIFLKAFLFRPQPMLRGVLEVHPGQRPIKVAFDFDVKGAPNTIVYELPLEGIDVSEYAKMVVPMRFDSGENHIVRLEVINRFRESGEVSITGVDKHWQDFIINVKDVPKLTDFKALKKLRFFLDKWNVNANKGTFYIGNVKFIKGD